MKDRISENVQKPIGQDELFNALHKKYVETSMVKHQFIYFRKKYCWIVVVEGAKLLKRILDITVSLIMLIFLTPLFILIAFLIKYTDNGPIFYVTKRVGMHGAEFAFPKFRSMRVDSDKIKQTLSSQNQYKDGVNFKMKNDPRVTSIGKFLRKFSLDELPQLWCVLKGDMSLVGPRPPLPAEVEKYTLAQRGRLEITPGLTCIWQVSGRSEIPFTGQVKLDMQYIESQSFLLDLKLLFLTIPAVILGKGAY